MKYTEKIHAKRLLGMLDKKNPCSGTCPACKNYLFEEGFIYNLGHYDTSPFVCSICLKFVGATRRSNSCPCYRWGEKEAIKRTWLALEEKGYLD